MMMMMILAIVMVDALVVMAYCYIHYLLRDPFFGTIHSSHLFASVLVIVAVIRFRCQWSRCIMALSLALTMMVFVVYFIGLGQLK